MKILKIQVVCPANAVTGGPESLHNLVAVLQSLGERASIVYFPFGPDVKTPEAYHHYGCAVEEIDDSPATLVILPEIYYSLTKSLEMAPTAIWWLSLDNFLERKYQNYRDRFRYLMKVIRRKRPLLGVKGVKCNLHFSKSYYDERYLNEHGIKTFRLSGPISNFYIEKGAQPEVNYERENVILFNNKKGSKYTTILRNSLPHLNFKALEGMGELELAQTYSKSKLYIDFGHHPGKERMPREAAVMGCCVVTGRFGSAMNDYDVPIPREFKLDQQSEAFVDDFKNICNKIFSDFDNQSQRFDNYRKEILEEPKTQQIDIMKILEVIRSVNFTTSSIN